MNTTPNLLALREINQFRDKPKLFHYFDEDYLMEYLVNKTDLKGHSDCVRTLKWNGSGSLLASASDDEKVIIWRAEREICRIDTNHASCILAVEFLPSKNGQTVFTGGADHFIMMHHMEYGQQCSWQTGGEVKRLCTVPSDPLLCWAGSEDKTIRQIDTRTNKVESLVSLKHPCQSFAMSEAKPDLIAVAVASRRTQVPIYDRRNVSQPVLKLRPWDYYGPSPHAVDVAFDRTGEECVISLNDGDVFVFDLDKSKDPKIMENFRSLFVGTYVPQLVKNEVGSLRDVKRLQRPVKNHSKAIDNIGVSLSKDYSNKAMRSVYYSNRAESFMMRNRRGDNYAAFRDCVKALQEHPGNSVALCKMAKTLRLLHRFADYKACILEMKQRFPTYDLTEAEKLIFHPRFNNSNGPRRFEDDVNYMDYKERYTNQNEHPTETYGVNFFGSRDQYIVAGTSSGHLVMWNREKAALLGSWECDSSQVYCVQPHPELPLLAAAGTDCDIKLFEP